MDQLSAAALYAEFDLPASIDKIFYPRTWRLRRAWRWLKWRLTQ